MMSPHIMSLYAVAFGVFFVVATIRVDLYRDKVEIREGVAGNEVLRLPQPTAIRE